MAKIPALKLLTCYVEAVGKARKLPSEPNGCKQMRQADDRKLGRCTEEWRTKEKILDNALISKVWFEIQHDRAL